MDIWILGGGLALCFLGIFLLVRAGHIWDLFDLEHFVSASKAPLGMALLGVGIVTIAGILIVSPDLRQAVMASALSVSVEL